MLAGRDLLAAAQTGTGKTAGFVLPLLQLLKTVKTKGSPDGRRPPRVLILTPTRELAAQVEESVRTYGAYLPTTSTVVYGGVGIQPQVTALKRGVEILVATPGRLLDHVQQKTVDLSRIEILVLDEADRMLDMGFIRDIRRILALLPKQRQNLLFSATFTQEIRELAHSFLSDPVVVEVARRNAPSELVSQVVHPVDAGRKRELLAHLISTGGWKQVLVFTRTKHGANRLAEQLRRDGISADAIHGNKSQSHRTRTLADFKGGRAARPGSDRPGRSRAGYRRAAARGELRSVSRPRGLCPSHRPHRPGRRRRRSGCAGVRGRPAAPGGHRAAAQPVHRSACGGRLRAGHRVGAQRAARSAWPALCISALRRARRRRTGRPTQGSGARNPARAGAPAQRRKAGLGPLAASRRDPASQPRSESAGQRGGRRNGPKSAGANGNGKRSAAPGAPRPAKKPEARPAQKQSPFAALLAGARRLIG